MLDALTLCEEVAGERLDVVTSTGPERATRAARSRISARPRPTWVGRPSTSLETGLRGTGRERRGGAEADRVAARWPEAA